ncbi:MAG: hypothetical protein KDA44_02935 [Planctomycetales bacterium]|nr:hypothetical protein [Planctomycetales bacterium]
MGLNVLSGAGVEQTLAQAVDRIRRQVDEHVAGMRELDGKIGELVERRGTALMDLAQHYLPDITLASIQSTFVEVRDDLLEVFARKQRRQQQLHDESAGCERQVEHLEAELKRVTDELNEKVAERERLEELLSERLHGSEEFQTLSARALDAEQELQRNEARVAEIQAEAAEKLPSYENSKLFMYLWDAGYGTAAYQAEGWTKRMDRWVAKLIDYPAARRGYHFLKATPELMAQEVDRRRLQFNDLMEQVEAIEDHVSDEIGLTTVMRAGQQLGAERDELVKSIAGEQDQLLAKQEELMRLEGKRNEFYEQAVDRMKTFLGNMHETRLQSESMATPDRRDDAIVAELTWLSSQLDDARGHGSSLAAERQAWDVKLSGLQSVLQNFRSAEFDSQRSVFDPAFDAGGHVQAFLDGRLTGEQLWAAIRQHQRFTPMWHEQPSSGGGGGGGGGIGDILGSEMSYVLFRVLTDVAGEAMRQSARRGMERREPIRRENRETSGRPTFRRRGFTNGRGF